MSGLNADDVLWWMLGSTPPWAMVTWPNSLFNGYGFSALEWGLLYITSMEMDAI